MYVGQYDITRHKVVINNPEKEHFSVFCNRTNVLVGYVILAEINNKNKSIELRRLVIERKGEGIGRFVLRYVKHYVFNVLKAHRLRLDVFTDNLRAINLYLSEGFYKEGIMRDCIIQEGRFRSQFLMSVIYAEGSAVIPKEIDHIHLIVRDLKETEAYLRTSFDLDTTRISVSENILMCENQFMHFFIKKADVPLKYLQEQHLSFAHGNIDIVIGKLQQMGISFQSGVFSKFKYKNYKWVEWRGLDEILFECIEYI